MLEKGGIGVRFGLGVVDVKGAGGDILAGKRSMMELPGAPAFPMAWADFSAMSIHLLVGLSTSRPYAILSTMATEQRRTAFVQFAASSMRPLQQTSASLRCSPTKWPILDLAKAGCRTRRWSWYFGPQRSQVSVGDHPILRESNTHLRQRVRVTVTPAHQHTAHQRGREVTGMETHSSNMTNRGLSE